MLGEDVKPSPGTARLLQAGVDWDEARRLGDQKPLAQIEGAIARMRREEKGIGWLVKCLREDWRVDAPPPDQPASRESPAVAATRAYREDLRQFGSWESAPEEQAAFEAMRRRLEAAGLLDPRAKRRIRELAAVNPWLEGEEGAARESERDF